MNKFARMLAGAFMAAGMMAAGTAADAATVVATFSGKVQSGIDTAGVFGGGSRAGDAYTLTLTWDDTLGLSAPGKLSGNTVAGIPLTGIALDIGGHTYNESVDVLAASLSGLVYYYPPVEHGVVFFGASARATGTSNNFYVNIGSWYGIGGGPVTFDDHSISGSAPQCYSCARENIDLDNGDKFILKTTSFSINGLGPSLTPLPEPSTWAMLVLGIAAMGWALRRSKTKLAAA